MDINPKRVKERENDVAFVVLRNAMGAAVKSVSKGRYRWTSIGHVLDVDDERTFDPNDPEHLVEFEYSLIPGAGWYCVCPGDDFMIDLCHTTTSGQTVLRAVLDLPGTFRVVAFHHGGEDGIVTFSDLIHIHPSEAQSIPKRPENKFAFEVLPSSRQGWSRLRIPARVGDTLEFQIDPSQPVQQAIIDHFKITDEYKLSAIIPNGTGSHNQLSVPILNWREVISASSSSPITHTEVECISLHKVQEGDKGRPDTATHFYRLRPNMFIGVQMRSLLVYQHEVIVTISFIEKTDAKFALGVYTMEPLCHFITKEEILNTLGEKACFVDSLAAVDETYICTSVEEIGYTLLQATNWYNAKSSWRAKDRNLAFHVGCRVAVGSGYKSYGRNGLIVGARHPIHSWTEYLVDFSPFAAVSESILIDPIDSRFAECPLFKLESPNAHGLCWVPEQYLSQCHTLQYCLQYVDQEWPPVWASHVTDLKILSDAERKEKIYKKAEPVENTCAICLEECVVANQETASTAVASGGGVKKTLTLSCSHTFHAACLSEWLSANENCPLCRSQTSTLRELMELCMEALKSDSSEFLHIYLRMDSRLINARSMSTITEGMTLLHLAVNRQARNCIRMLIQEGADPCVIDSSMIIPDPKMQRYPSVYNKRYILERLDMPLLQRPVSAVNQLHQAVASNDIALIRELYELGVNLESNVNMFTPFWKAAQAGHYEVMKVLASLGVNPDTPRYMLFNRTQDWTEVARPWPNWTEIEQVLPQCRHIYSQRRR